jgi:hypothetical protein
VLERYPQNGKLLKIWGRFQVWVLLNHTSTMLLLLLLLLQGVGTLPPKRQAA